MLSPAGEAVAASNGVFLINFEGLDGRMPTPEEVARAPFGDRGTRGLASHLAIRRVEVLNAHQLCLLSAIGTRVSPEDVWSPDPRPVNVRTLLTGTNEQTLSVPPEILGQLVEFMTSSNTFPKSLFAITPEVVDHSFDLLETVVAASDVAVRSCHMVLHAARHYWHWRFDQGMATAWPAVEAMLSDLWSRYIQDRSAAEDASEHQLNSTRRQRLLGREFTTSIITEALALAGVIDHALYNEIRISRAARNKWVHGLAPVSADALCSAVWAFERLFMLSTGIQLAVPLTLADSTL